MAERILDIKDLYVSFDTYAGEVQAVRGVSYHVDAGEVLAVVGESGCGKSVTAQTIMKLNPMPPARIKSGELTLDGIDIVATPEDAMQKIRGKEVSMIFQDPMTSLNPTMQVGKQIVEAIKHHQNMKDDEAQALAIEMLKKVQIPNAEERAKQYPHQYSGGMRQRAMIAMALSCNPKLLIADEPTTALDVTIQAQVLDLIDNLKKKFNTSLVLITHDLGVVAEVCDKVAIVYAGKIVEYGNLKHIYNNPLHPYTKGLFGSIPDFSHKAHRLNPIKGLMPDPSNLPEGCAFAERCPHATDACRSKQPEELEVETGHFVRCLLYEKEGQ